MSNISKVIYNTNTVIDITDSTVTPDTLAEGVTAHSADGSKITGIVPVGAVINGIISEYTVAAGENISAGDFVSFVNGDRQVTASARLNATEYSCRYQPSAVKLSDNKVFIAHAYGASYYLYGTIVTISGTTLTAVTSHLSGIQYSCYAAPSATLVSDNKVFIATRRTSDSYLYGYLVTITGTSMLTKVTQLSSTVRSCNDAPSAVALSESLVFVGHRWYTGSTYNLYGTLVSISGSTMSASSKVLDSSTNSCKTGPSSVALGTNKVFVAYSFGSTSQLSGTIVTISGTSITSSSNTVLNHNSYSCYYDPSAMLLSDGRVFVAHSYSSSCKLYGSLINVSGSDPTLTTSTALDTTADVCDNAPSVTQLTDSELFIVYADANNKTRGATVFINGTSMTATTEQLYSSSFNDPSVINLGTERVYISGSAPSQLHGMVYEPAQNVISYTSGSEIGGVANQSGAGGATIEVYIPNV